jgi:hypothetical protein
MTRYAEGHVANVIWGGRFYVAAGLRWVADKVHEDLRYRVSGCTYRLVPGEGIKIEWGGQGTPLLYAEKDHELFHPEGDRWVPAKEVKKMSEEIADKITGRKWTRDQVDEIMGVFDGGR